MLLHEDLVREEAWAEVGHEVSLLPMQIAPPASAPSSLGRRPCRLRRPRRPSTQAWEAEDETAAFHLATAEERNVLMPKLEALALSV